MGGNALKHLSPVRLSSAEVVDLSHHLHRLWQLVAPSCLYLVPWIASKRDHGDVDVIAEIDGDPTSVVHHFARLLGADPAAIVRNGTVFSTPVPVPWDAQRLVQVDLISCAPEAAPMMRFFYAGGDFGMLLGRVAAWHGLVFGMDGLRYRADADAPWQRDVLLSRDPAQILHLLGYGPPPFFDTYPTLWRYIIDGPMAGAWMFLPTATNAENRSRDRQRRMIGEFQEWVAATYPDRLTAPTPRATPAQARAWVAAHCPWIDLTAELSRQEAAWTETKARVRALGLAAVEDVVADGVDMAARGAVIRAMQRHLPPPAARAAIMDDPQRRSDLEHLARVAARLCARELGLPLR